MPISTVYDHELSFFRPMAMLGLTKLKVLPGRPETLFMKLF
jgi:hypothetical protein